MKVFIDASIFLKLLLDEPGADQAQELLEAVEDGRLVGYVTPLVLEEVSFKLLYARASELLDTKNIWRIREALKSNDGVRRACSETLKEFHSYIEYMESRGLKVEPVTGSDWRSSLTFTRQYGLLPADALHLAVALRVGAQAIATFDEDFQHVKEISTIP